MFKYSCHKHFIYVFCSGLEERQLSFPPLEGVEYSIAEIFQIKAWTLKGKGIFLREPPFLPHAFQLRGEKIKGTPAFRNNKFFIPDM
jgi:hypothetical protein